MLQPRAFCRAVMHEYERQWSRATGHGVRHPLRLKMAILSEWCATAPDTADEFAARLVEAEAADDPGLALLGQELRPLWARTQAGEPLPFKID